VMLDRPGGEWRAQGVTRSSRDTWEMENEPLPGLKESMARIGNFNLE
jgi:hypothetical protein